MYQQRPVIGITGGIGSGKSFVAKLFGELGSVVIESDVLVTLAYQNPWVVETIRSWWGESIVSPSGQIDRKVIAERIFQNPRERTRLEELIHPRVAAARQDAMERGAQNAQVVAFVWDTPLLFETGLSAECDATVFVDADEAVRVERVRSSRGWSAAELAIREKTQWPLEKKRQLAHYIVKNTADAEFARGQVREVLSRILETSRLGRSRAPDPMVGHVRSA